MEIYVGCLLPGVTSEIANSYYYFNNTDPMFQMLICDFLLRNQYLDVFSTGVAVSFLPVLMCLKETSQY